MSLLVVGTSRTQEDGVVSVPAEGSITSSVSSIVDMIRSCVRLRGTVAATTSRQTVPGLQLIIHLSGLSHQSGHSVDWQSLTDQG